MLPGKSWFELDPNDNDSLSHGALIIKLNDERRKPLFLQRAEKHIHLIIVVILSHISGQLDAKSNNSTQESLAFPKVYTSARALLRFLASQARLCPWNETTINSNDETPRC